MTGAGPSVVVRTATRDDVAVVTTIERDTFTLPWSRHSFLGLVQSPGVDFLVAVVGGDGGSPSVAGYSVSLSGADHCELANLAVTKTARGHGVGRLLLNSAIERARARGATEMFLEVRASNHTAQRLYASVGFREVARRRRYYEKPVEDALVLRLDLRSRMVDLGAQAIT